jgi:hypothetical protein
MTTDPLAGLTKEQVEAIIKDYKTPTLTFRDVVRRNNIGKDRVMRIVRACNVPERGRHVPSFTNRKRMYKPDAASPFSDIALERAKLTLRKRGWIVFAAEVTDGSRGKGYFRCDGKLWTREQVMEAAAK